MEQRGLAGRLLKPVVFAAACLPLIVLVVRGFTGGLGANPVEFIEHATGDWALRLLLITLAVTPLRRLTGWNALVRMRRMIGLFAFFYVCLHFSVYAVLDAGLSPAYIAADVLKRPYITVGFTAFCLLIPLAVTSTDRMVRRLGGKRWRVLHRLVYATAALGVLHYLWEVKADIRQPLLYAFILGVLLLLRLPPLARRLGGPRLALQRRRERAAASQRARCPAPGHVY